MDYFNKMKIGATEMLLMTVIFEKKNLKDQGCVERGEMPGLERV